VYNATFGLMAPVITAFANMKQPLSSQLTISHLKYAFIQYHLLRQDIAHNNINPLTVTSIDKRLRYEQVMQHNNKYFSDFGYTLGRKHECHECHQFIEHNNDDGTKGYTMIDACVMDGITIGMYPTG